MGFNGCFARNSLTKCEAMTREKTVSSLRPRDLAEKYRNWARQLAFEYPYVAGVVEGIAQRYDQEAEMWDSESAVRRRLGH
jgi:hypothetical protein